MNNSFISIVNHLSHKAKEENSTEKELETFLSTYKKVSKNIGKLPIQRDLTGDIVICFALNPIKDSDWKVYKKLKPNAKVGFISRKLMSMARKLDISQTNIRRFVNAKRDWDFSKKYNNRHKDREKIEDAVKEILEDKKISKMKSLLYSEHNATYTQRSMFQETNFFVDLIIGKSLEKI